MGSHARSYDSKTVQYLNEDEIGALMRAIDSPRDRAIFELASHRGLRASEVGLIMMSDLRLPARRIYVHRLKGSNSGEYPLFDGEIRALRAWLRIRGYAPGPLFPSRNHRPISRIRLHVLMNRYAQRAGIPPAKRHFHCLRHTAGTMASEHCDFEEVMDLLGSCVYFISALKTNGFSRPKLRFKDRPVPERR